MIFLGCFIVQPVVLVFIDWRCLSFHIGITEQ
uniref:Uncharacterized protein n=1 Tax=Anguilla anguilla TaxID=7936 RepID=A0A0E9RNJ7_ANGAN